jgi:sulfotransferase 6B1
MSRTPPPLLLNSMPKSGTNLMLDVIEAMCGVEVIRGAIYQGRPTQTPDHEAVLAPLQPGMARVGHIFWSPAYADMLERLGVDMVMMLRDPRDVIVSFVHFFVTGNGRWSSDPIGIHLRAQMDDHQERLRAMLTGIAIPGGTLPDMAAWTWRFLPWEMWPGAIPFRYEELVDPGGQRAALGQLADALIGPDTPRQRERAIERGCAAISGRDNITFRRGVIGAWREEFDPETRELARDVLGDVLIALGYETGLDW